GDLHTIPDAAPLAPDQEKLAQVSPGPRTPMPTDFNQFLKHGPDSGATLSRRGSPRPPESSGTHPNAKTAAPPAAPRSAKLPAPEEAPAALEPLPKVSPGAIPVLTKPMEELMSFPFTPPEAFIVSRINGMWDVRSIARISPFPEPDVLRMFQKLRQSGVISFK
ncbi:MAG: hypothetical protein ACXVH0_03000, partial [Thermoanaerobaculia bacterium]